MNRNNKYFYITDNTQDCNTYYGVQMSKESLYNMINNLDTDSFLDLYAYVNKRFRNGSFIQLTMDDFQNSYTKINKQILKTWEEKYE